MRSFLLLLFVAACIFSASAQSDITTIIFVRHAEKVNDGTKDPALSPEGMNRATLLADLLSRQPLNAVYSTNYIRTKSTVEPAARAASLTLNIYDSMTPEKLKEIISVHNGGTILICGHSNTTPAMINLLTGEETFKQWEDSDYGNLVMVSVSAAGKAKITRLRY